MRILSDTEYDEYTSAPGWQKYKGKCPTCWNAGSYLYNGATYLCGDEDDYHEQRDLWKLYCLARLPEEHCRLDWASYPMEEAASVVDQYISAFQSNLVMGTGLTICAQALGIGKTWAATHALQELSKAGFTGYFIDFWILKSLYGAEDKARTVRRLRESQVVVVDDLLKPYTDKQEPFYQDTLEEVLRFRTMSNLPTIVTTNMTDAEFLQYYPRVFSLLRGKQIEVMLPDSRDHRMKEADEIHDDWRLSAMKGEVWPLR